jgi:hypothetical protein
VTPTGGQIETTAGVNLSQYYACLYGGQNNPGCSGYTPQPPTGYGYLHNQAANAFASGLKVDGALTLWGPGEVAGQASRNGTSQQLSIWISPALSGTPLVNGESGSFVQRTRYIVQNNYLWDDEEGGSKTLAGSSIVGFINETTYVPGGGQSGQNSSEPPVRKLDRNSALEHFTGGTGAPIRISFGDVNTNNVRADEFKQVQDDLKKGCSDRSTAIDARLAFATTGEEAYYLGSITLRLQGTLSVSQNCNWSFSGNLRSFDDVYDFNASTHRGIIGELLTWWGRQQTGRPYDIQIRGEKTIAQTGKVPWWNRPWFWQR